VVAQREESSEVPKPREDPEHWRQGYMSTNHQLFGVKKYGILHGKFVLG
jgi:hypothetical protein